MAIDTTGPGSVVASPDTALRSKLRSSSNQPTSVQEVEILDIRRDTESLDILHDIKQGLRPNPGLPKTLPTLLLYDEAGLRLFEKITYLEQYYLTNAEIEVLETYAHQIAERIQPKSVIVELGSGNLRKVNILLQALERSKKDVQYYALDLDLDELKRTFSAIPATGYRHVECFGLHGTYDDGLEWLNSPHIRGKAKTILWLGSSIGNFKRADAKSFLTGYQNALAAGDMLLIGIDACKEPSRVYDAYNDKDEVTHHFILNGLEHANRVLGQPDAFSPEDWEVVGEFSGTEDCHQAFVSPVRDVSVDGVAIAKGEKIRIEQSHKYSTEEANSLFRFAGLNEGCKWSTQRGDYALYLVCKPQIMFPTTPGLYAASPVPSLQDWDQLWKVWDDVTLKMIPKEELLSQPIDLRNVCVFYLGHIPTFLDIRLAHITDGPPTEPSYFRTIFERGRDPDVDNPTQCHSHSEIPDTWPPLEDVLKFQQAVRNRVHSIYESGAARLDGRIARGLWLGFEHEVMHIETLLYMLVQSKSIRPPPDTVMPDFRALASQAASNAVPNEWFKIPEADIVLGLDDSELESRVDRYFGWDNEKPSRSVHVQSFSAKARPITNGEYAAYLEKTGRYAPPASWSDSPYYLGGQESPAHENGAKEDAHVANGNANVSNGDIPAVQGKYVRTVFGAIPLEHALDWPVVASYDELAGCAKWMGGRIPTLEETRSIYAHVERMKTKDVENALGKTIPAVNSQLGSEGVEETPPSRGVTNGSSDTASSAQQQDLFVDVGGKNVGFKHWHPTPVTQNGKDLAGQGDFGGVWEWTSTVLEQHKGFEPMSMYPDYTADFFDGKHNITLGGSWATHPRIAGRKTFVNWYQRNYRYAWAGARLVRDN